MILNCHYSVGAGLGVRCGREIVVRRLLISNEVWAEIFMKCGKSWMDSVRHIIIMKSHNFWIQWAWPIALNLAENWTMFSALVHETDMFSVRLCRLSAHTQHAHDANQRNAQFAVIRMNHASVPSPSLTHLLIYLLHPAKAALAYLP